MNTDKILTSWLEKQPYDQWSDDQKHRAALAFSHVMALDMDNARQFVADVTHLIKFAETGSDR